MPGFTDTMLSGLPVTVGNLLTSAPVTKKKLLELSIRWDDLPSGNARMAEALRVFVLTWDPLETAPSRPGAFAVVNTDPVEVVLYIPLWSLAGLAAERTVVSALGELAGGVVMNAWANEFLAAVKEPVDLLESPESPDGPDGPFGAPAEAKAVDGGWGDIGLGAITDIVKHAHGPVDLDRSLVELRPAAVNRPGCPACAGKQFGFIADLVESQKQMCAAHRKEADVVWRKRFARAQTSNPRGWRAITDASTRLSRPHLPNGLLTKIADIETVEYSRDDPGELASRARLVAEAARWFPGRVHEFAAALGDEAGLPGWLMRLVLSLGSAGLGEEAVLVADALTSVDPSRAAVFAGDAMVAMADAGLADESRAKVEENLARWPDDVLIRLRAGDALELLGDREVAVAYFEEAQQMAVASKDFRSRRDAAERVRQITGAVQSPPPTVERHQHRGKKSRSARRR